MVTRKKTRRQTRVVRAKPAPRAARVPAELPRKLFLAGLGAFSLARKQGERLIDELAAEGETLRTRADRLAAKALRDARRYGDALRRDVDRRIAPLQRQARQALRVARTNVEAAVERLHVPTPNEVRELLGRVTGLNRQVPGRRRKRAA